VTWRQQRQALRRWRHRLVEQADELASLVSKPNRVSPAETLAAEVLPLVDGIRFLERRAAAVLKPRRLGRRGRPIWLAGVSARVERAPLGVVLIIGPGNYPLLLVAAQAAQAVAAGNAAVIKPAPGGEAVADRFAALAVEAGLEEGLIQVLDTSVEAAQRAIGVGVDKVLLTGSVTSGRAVLHACAETITPATVELSGCDAAFVLPSADLSRVVDALTFGLRLNGGETCIAPRRVFVPKSLAAELERRLAERVAALPRYEVGAEAARRARQAVGDAIEAGARLVTGQLPASSGEGPGRETRPPADGASCDGRGVAITPMLVADAEPAMRLLRTDLFAPAMALVPVDDLEAALAADAQCPYALSASVFGESGEARRIARHVLAGSVVINDLIVPTADPRLPFGGRGLSGFGVTRGPEGLLALTAPKVTAERRGRWLPHLDEPGQSDTEAMRGLLELSHGAGWGGRWRGLKTLWHAMSRRQAGRRTSPPTGRSSP
jgi:acyl-CoA reductase-like NAD-dependent aldehyde dehydrogenase